MEDIWLIGIGAMGVEYAKILNALKINYIAVGRGDAKAKLFETSTGKHPVTGGLEKFLITKPGIPSAVIVAVGVDVLAETTQKLLDYGVTKILLEKPGVGDPKEIDALVLATELKNANVLLAYNRRFYSSVLKAEEIINIDGGVTSFNFEFTEWSHIIEKLDKSKVTMENWFLANSTHVVDTAFFLGGLPTKISTFHQGGTAWHPSGSIYAGAGISTKAALFSYQANWEAPGRWAIEVLTRSHRLYLKPMESLQIQEIGSVSLSPVELHDHLDKEFKPGFYLQTKAFLEGDYTRFCTLKAQQENINNFYLKMCGY